jgi:hypothetical protein
MEAQGRLGAAASGRITRRTVRRIGIGLTTLAALFSVIVTAGVIWLMLTRPLVVADALDERNVVPIVRALTSLVTSVVLDLLRFL